MSFSTRGFDWMAFILGFLCGGLFIVVLVAIILFPEALPGLTFFGGGILVGLLFAATFWLLDRQRHRVPFSQPMKFDSNFVSASLPSDSNSSHANLTDLELDVLTTIKQRNSISQSDLVRILDIPRSTVSETLRDLEQKGLIFREKRGRTYEIRSNRS
ncbi:MAG: helix-turn-helix transcriptional regulator [Promethearchaeota archaeon]